MVIQTRSAARRAQDIGSAIPEREGTLVTIEPSATGLGVHKRWHYPDAAVPRIRDDESFSSSSSSSLSSLSSSRDWGSSLSSLSSLESMALLDPSRDAKQDPHPHPHPRSHPAPPETPRPIPGSQKRTPLKRSPLIRWETDGTTRRLVVPNTAYPYSQDDARMKEEAATKKMDEVFEKQYALMMRQREMAMLSMTRSDDDDDEMDDESVESFEGSVVEGARPLVRGDTHPAFDEASHLLPSARGGSLAPSFASGSDYDPFLVDALARNDTHMDIFSHSS